MGFGVKAKISPQQLDIINMLKELDANVRIKWDDAVDAPSLIYGNLSVPHDTLKPESAIGFLGDIKELFRMEDPARELSMASETGDKAGNAVYLFQQTYKGIPVEGSIVRVHYTPHGTVSRVSNAYVPGIDVETKPAIDESAAFRSAIDDAGQGWKASETPATLKIVSVEGTWYLVWQVIVFNGRRSSAVYYVNAADGKVLYNKGHAFHGSGTGYYCGQQSLNTSPGQGSARLLADKTRGYGIFVHDLYWPGKFPWMKLINDSAGQCAIAVSWYIKDENISKDEDDKWDAAGTSRWENQSPEVDLAYYFGKVADYFNDLSQKVNKVDHKSFNGKGRDIHVGAHDGNQFGLSAYFDEYYNEFYFGDGDGDSDVYDATGKRFTSTQSPSTSNDGKGMNYLTSRDIVAHEFTHAVICNTARFEYCGEHPACVKDTNNICVKCPTLVLCQSRASGKHRFVNCEQSNALHEAIADIFACYITGNPDLGKGVIIDPGHTCLRTLNNPSSDRALSRHSNHMRANSDNMGKGITSCLNTPLDRFFNPQDNVGPVVYAGYLLAYGGIHPRTGIEVNGIGAEKAAMILFHALTNELLTPSGQYSRATFLDFREAMLGAVDALFGGTGEYIEVRNSAISAFNAVGIGNILVIPRHRVRYDRILIQWPWRHDPPDQLRGRIPRGLWPARTQEPIKETRRVLMYDYGDGQGVIALGNGEDVKRQRDNIGRPLRKEFATIKIMNAGIVESEALVNLFACSPENIGEPSGWKWIGSSIVDNIKPGEEATAKIAIGDKKALAGLNGRDNGEICLIAQIDSSMDQSPFKAEESLKELRYIDLENSEFISCRVKMSE